MKEEVFEAWDKDRVPKPIGLAECRQSAVIIPILMREKEPEILFEVRSSQLSRQPGDICFPGGHVEKKENPWKAAQREICEELLLSPGQVSLKASLDYLLTGNLVIYPFLAELKGYEGNFSKQEVAEVFTVPLSYFLENEPEAYQVFVRKEPENSFPYDRITGGRDYRFHEWKETSLFYQVGRYTIWGYTARIMYTFTKEVKEKSARN